MATKRKGKSAAYLRMLRKRYGLGEYAQKLGRKGRIERMRLRGRRERAVRNVTGSRRFRMPARSAKAPRGGPTAYDLGERWAVDLGDLNQ